MKKIKVVSAKNMRSIEVLAYAEGHQELDFMEKAGSFIAEATESFVEGTGKSKVVTLLVGKGNNGGDAYVAGRRLLEKGFRVTALHLYPPNECSPLCLLQKENFERSSGSIIPLYEKKEIVFPIEGVILDGLVGTGFKGKAEGVLANLISLANGSNLPILAIDIPSGVSGDTGEVGSVAIEATLTFYLELPKLGFFLKDGWNHVGKLIQIQFGLPSSLIDQANPDAFLIEKPEVKIPVLKKNHHKYNAGYVLVVAGSLLMSGAGMLTSFAALRSGAGIVRWFYPPEIENFISSAPWEVIKEPFEDLHQLLKEQNRAGALVIGPGMGRDSLEIKKMKKVLSRFDKPCVIDADALYFLAKSPSFNIPSQSILTPHFGELKRLLKAHSLSSEDFLASCQFLVQKKNTTLLVKGGPNFLFAPNEIPHILPFGNPGMATAGSGDVLSGILGALLAKGLSPHETALLGCYLHGKAGDVAETEKTAYSMIASDILNALPLAIKSLS